MSDLFGSDDDDSDLDMDTSSDEEDQAANRMLTDLQRRNARRVAMFADDSSDETDLSDEDEETTDQEDNQESTDGPAQQVAESVAQAAEEDAEVLTRLMNEHATPAAISAARAAPVRRREGSPTPTDPTEPKRIKVTQCPPTAVDDVRVYAQAAMNRPQTDTNDLIVCPVTQEVPNACVLASVGPLRNQLYPVDVTVAIRECMDHLGKWLQSFFDGHDLFDRVHEDDEELLMAMIDELCNSQTMDQFTHAVLMLRTTVRMRNGIEHGIRGERRVPPSREFSTHEQFPHLTLHRPYDDITYCNTDDSLHLLARYMLRRALDVQIPNRPINASDVQVSVDAQRMRSMLNCLKTRSGVFWRTAALKCTLAELVTVFPTCSALNDMLANLHNGRIMTATCCAQIVNSISQVMTDDRHRECLQLAQAVRDWRQKRRSHIVPCMLCTAPVPSHGGLTDDTVYDVTSYLRGPECDSIFCAKCHAARETFINDTLFPFKDEANTESRFYNPNALQWHTFTVDAVSAAQDFDEDTVLFNLTDKLGEFVSKINGRIACSGIAFRLIIDDMETHPTRWSLLREALLAANDTTRATMASNLPKVQQLHMLPTISDANWMPGLEHGTIASDILDTTLVTSVVEKMTSDPIYQRIFRDNLPTIKIQVALLQTAIRPQDLHKRIDKYMRKLPSAPFVLAGGSLPSHPRAKPQSTVAKPYFDRGRVEHAMTLPRINTPRHFVRC